MPTASSFAIAGCVAWTPIEYISNALILVDRGVVSYAGPAGSIPLPSGAEVFDFGGKLVCPGFIDLQVNGLGGSAVMAGEADAVVSIARELARRGTSGFLPTLTTESGDKLLASAQAVRRAWEILEKENFPAASILGIHLEGPFISPKMAGAHPAEHIRPIDLEEIVRIADAAGGWGAEGRPGLVLATLSPELDGAAEAAGWFRRRGVVAAMGHTAAKNEDVERFISAGASFAVHAYNRYGAPEEEGHPETGLPYHRAPGPMTAVASDPRLMAGLIADGVHVHPGIVSGFLQGSGWARTALTSDLVSDRGLSGREEGRVSGPAVRSGGVLTGSRLSIGEMVPLLKKWCPLDNGRILATASWNPARLLGLEGKRGCIRTKARADFCILDPESLEMSAAMVAGEWAVGP
jgi:N-acetylglucosamine-6-phosphate deacetylase